MLAALTQKALTELLVVPAVLVGSKHLSKILVHCIFSEAVPLEVGLESLCFVLSNDTIYMKITPNMVFA